MPDMLRATRRKVFRFGYDLTEDDGRSYDPFNPRREVCDFTAAGERLRAEREGNKRFVLTGPRGVMATADRESGRRWLIATTDGHVTLVKPSIWREGWELHDGERVLGGFRRDGVFSMNAHSDVVAEVPAALRVFAFHVVLVLWARAAAAAA